MLGLLNKNSSNYFFSVYFFLGENLKGRRRAIIVKQLFHMESGIELNLEGSAWVRLA